MKQTVLLIVATDPITMAIAIRDDGLVVARQTGKTVRNAKELLLTHFPAILDNYRIVEVPQDKTEKYLKHQISPIDLGYDAARVLGAYNARHTPTHFVATKN
jgi:hypothetical protein